MKFKVKFILLGKEKKFSPIKEYHIIINNVESLWLLPSTLREVISGIKFPLVIREGEKTSKMYLSWEAPAQYNYDSLRALLREVWRDFLVEESKEHWSCIPVFLTDVSLTSLFLRKLERTFKIFFGLSSGIKHRKRVKEVIKKLNSYTTQDLLYVDPEWYM